MNDKISIESLRGSVVGLYVVAVVVDSCVCEISRQNPAVTVLADAPYVVKCRNLATHSFEVTINATVSSGHYGPEINVLWKNSKHFGIKQKSIEKQYKLKYTYNSRVWSDQVDINYE